MKVRIVVVLLAVTALSALATFTYFSNFAALTEGRRGSPIAGYVGPFLWYLLLSAPFLLVAVLIWPVRVLIIAASVHAAIFFTLLAITSITFRPGHSSFGDSVAPVILTVLWLILTVELAMIGVALGRSPTVEARASFLCTFAGLTVPLVGGWALGVLAWSETLPSEVIASAEDMAGLQPYCLEVDGRPVDRIRDLVAWSMLARNRGGYTANFHALMVMGVGSERAYANWSYRQGRFVSVSEDVRANTHLDREVECEPSQHFLLKL